jgi:histidinol-phosphate aminotransferase
VTSVDSLPVREDLRGRSPYGAPQLDVAVRLNVNENPYPPSEALVAAIASAVADAARGLNRYPDRDAVALRNELGAYLRREGLAVDATRVWAANGSNEVMLQLLQAFGGPGRRVLGFVPTYAMYPDYARDTCTAWVTADRTADFRSTPTRRSQPCGRTSRRSSSSPRPTTRRARHCRST